jgi:hypothetical protein
VEVADTLAAAAEDIRAAVVVVDTRAAAVAEDITNRELASSAGLARSDKLSAQKPAWTRCGLLYFIAGAARSILNLKMAATSLHG